MRQLLVRILYNLAQAGEKSFSVGSFQLLPKEMLFSDD